MPKSYISYHLFIDDVGKSLSSGHKLLLPTFKKRSSANLLAEFNIDIILKSTFILFLFLIGRVGSVHIKPAEDKKILPKILEKPFYIKRSDVIFIVYHVK